MNFLIINPNDENSNYAEMLADNGQRLKIRQNTPLSKYAAEVVLQGQISGLFDGEFDLRDEVTLFSGAEFECYNYLVKFAYKHFDVVTVVQSFGAAKKKCECGGPYYVNYGEEVCQSCIDHPSLENTERASEPDGIPF